MISQMNRVTLETYFTTNNRVSDEATKSWVTRNQHTMKAVVKFVNIINGLAYDWMIKDE